MSDESQNDQMFYLSSENEEVSRRKDEFRKCDFNEISSSSNEDFEVIGRQQRRTSKQAVSEDESVGSCEIFSSGSSTELIKNNIKRRRPASVLSFDSPKKRPMELPQLAKSKLLFDETTAAALAAATSTSRDKSNTSRDDLKEQNGRQHKSFYSRTPWKTLLIVAAAATASQFFMSDQLHFKRPKMDYFERYRDENSEETVRPLQRIIEKMENKLKSCMPQENYILPVRIQEERATAFQRRNGFSYYFVIVDWKKDDQGMAQQHLHLAFKQSNNSVYVYDHGPLSGKQFAVGDRIIDVDGKSFSKATEVRDQILWSHHNKDYFTSIIERPSTDQTMRAVSSLLQPALSSFSVILST